MRSKHIASAGAVSVTKTVSNGQSGQYFFHSAENGGKMSAYLSHEQTTTVQSGFFISQRCPQPFP